MILVENPEIIFNFWYIHDEMGIIYSLRARAYVGVGTDEEKLTTLQEYAELDYLIAQPYPIPLNFHLEIVEGSRRQKMPVTSLETYKTLNGPLSLFEEAIKDIESKLPLQTKLEVSKSPITCITPLIQDDEGEIFPVFSKSQRFEDMK